jgi:hypothetical protein
MLLCWADRLSPFRPAELFWWAAPIRAHGAEPRAHSPTCGGDVKRWREAARRRRRRGL